MGLACGPLSGVPSTLSKGRRSTEFHDGFLREPSKWFSSAGPYPPENVQSAPQPHKNETGRTSRAPRSRILKLPKEPSGVLGILTRPKSCLQGISFKPFQKLRFATQGGRAPESSVKTTWHRPQRKVKIGSSAKFTPPEKGLISIREAPKAAKLSLTGRTYTSLCSPNTSVPSLKLLGEGCERLGVEVLGAHVTHAAST